MPAVKSEYSTLRFVLLEQWSLSCCIYIPWETEVKSVGDRGGARRRGVQGIQWKVEKNIEKRKPPLLTVTFRVYKPPEDYGIYENAFFLCYSRLIARCEQESGAK